MAKLASSQLARISLLLCLCRSVLGDGEEVVTEKDVEGAAKIIEYFLAHTRRVHDILFKETEEERLLRVLSEVVNSQGEEDGSGARRIKMPPEELRRALQEGGVHDVSAANQLTKALKALAEKEPRLRVEQAWFHGGRALEVILLPAVRPDILGDTVGAVGTVGAGESAPVSLPGAGGARLVKFAWRDGPLLPDEIAERTGLSYGMVKKIVSELRGKGEIEDTGAERGQSRQVRLPIPKADWTNPGA